MIQADARLLAQLARARRLTFVLGGATLVLACLGGVAQGPAAFFRAYLVALVFVAGLAIGCLGVALVHQLTGGQWGVAIERIVEAGARTLPWLIVAFVPVFAWLALLYPWARADVVAGDPVLQHKRVYLNVPFFIVRTIVCFAVWTVLAWLLDRFSVRQDATGDPRTTLRLKQLAGPGAVGYAFTVTFFAIDWIMSLEPRWYSTVYGGMVGVQWMLGAFTLAILLVNAAAGRAPFDGVLSSKVRIDLGNMLLTFTILWMYLAFVQLLIIWAGNVPEEVAWYVSRLRGGWQGVAIFLVVVQFLLPLLALLMRALKQRRTFMMALCGLLLFAHWGNALWLVSPAFHGEGFSLSWLDVVLPLALGGLWSGLFLTLLARRPLLPLHDPALPLAEREYA